MTEKINQFRDEINVQIFQPLRISSYASREIIDSKMSELYERMKSERERLASFNNWPIPCISPRELAKYGFYYIGERDRVKCTFCKGIVAGWQEGDLPLNEHRRHFPRCPFLVGYNVGNIAIDEDPMRNLNTEAGHDVCGIHFRLMAQNINMNSSSKVHSLPTNGNAKYIKNGVPCGPKNTDYVTINSRLRSFDRNWPKSSPAKPQQLAEAGFFHIGMDDYVKCFYCDGGLCHWEKEDEPWEEHMKWFPDCEFIRLMKNDVAPGKTTFVTSKRSETKTSSSSPSSSSANPVTNVSSKSESATVKANNNQTPIKDSGLSSSNSSVSTSSTSLNSDHEMSETELLSSENNSNDNTVFSGEILKESASTSTSSSSASIAQSPSNENSSLNNAVQVVVEVAEENLNCQSDEDSAVASGASSLSTSPTPTLSNSSEAIGPVCKICLDLDVNIVFIPCMHAIACVECALGISHCPICRSSIIERKRLYFS